MFLFCSLYVFSKRYNGVPWLRVLQRYFCNNCLCWLNSFLNLTITVLLCETFFFDFSSDKLSFVLGIVSFFTNQLFFDTFWKSKHLRQVLIISMFVRELLVLFWSTVYTFYPRIQTTNINSQLSQYCTKQNAIYFDFH